MATTFQQAYTRLMGQISRPLTETDVLAEAKAAINDAVLYLQRDHAYHYTERLTQFTYPAQTLTVKLTAVCEGLLRDIHSFQNLATPESNGGIILEYKTYHQIQAARRKYQRSHPNWNSDEEWSFLVTQFGHETYVNRISRFYVFITGQDLGLYPTPSQDIELLMNAHIWLPPLVENDDTNFFLDYAYDVIITIALKRMSMYMKEDNRFNVTQVELTAMVAGLVAWDSQVAESPQTPLL